MLNGKELKAGNYVVFQGEIMVVEEVLNSSTVPHGIGVHLVKLDGNRPEQEISISSRDLDALPITKDYLIEVGFKKIADDVFFLKGFVVVFFDDEIHLNFGENQVTHNTGFHQLQNEYFKFSGVDLPGKIIRS